MTVQIDAHAWRRALAIGILPFAALGVAGCENTGGEEQEQEQGQEQEQEGGQEQEEGGEEEDD